MRLGRADPAWRLLVIEFRVFAARDRKLNRRYAELHERAVAGVAALLELLYQRTGVTQPAPVATLARSLMAIESGGGLEEAAAGETTTLPEMSALLRRVLGAPPLAAAKTRRRAR